MRRTAAFVTAAICGLAACAAPLQPAAAQTGGAPHAWLYGAWTGGIFPVTPGLTQQACLAQPTVIFTRDVVMRSTLTEVTFTQRVIETARNSPAGTDFQFAPAVDPVAATSRGLLGMEPPKPAAGFGCESSDVLHVQRRSENEIVFPGCQEFPSPLVRCAAR